MTGCDFADDFDQLDRDVQIQHDTSALDVRWAVGCHRLHPGLAVRHGVWGCANMARMPSAQLVYTNGAVTLFRVRNPTGAVTDP